MSVTITYTSLTDLINALSSNATVAEAIIMQAQNLLVTYGAEITLIAGVAGARTGSYTQAEAGAILQLACAVYSQSYLTSGGSSKNISLQGVSLGQSSNASSGAGSLNDLAEKLAKQLIASDVTLDPPIFVSNDPVPTS